RELGQVLGRHAGLYRQIVEVLGQFLVLLRGARGGGVTQLDRDLDIGEGGLEIRRRLDAERSDAQERRPRRGGGGAHGGQRRADHAGELGGGGARVFQPDDEIPEGAVATRDELIDVLRLLQHVV